MKRGFITTHQNRNNKTQQSAGKVLASAFWDADGILLIDSLEHGRVVNADYYVALLDRLDVILRINTSVHREKNILFLHDNAPAHKSHKAMAKLEQLGYENWNNWAAEIFS